MSMEKEQKAWLFHGNKQLPNHSSLTKYPNNFKLHVDELILVPSHVDAQERG